MAIRLSGINSGLDTDAIVQELVSAYSLKTQKYEKAQTKLSWKQDIWKSLNTKIYGLYTNVSNLRLSSAYSLRKTTVSDNTKASVTASGTAPTGTQSLNVIEMAQAGYLTGGKLEAWTGEKVTGDTRLSDLGYDAEASSIEVKKNDGTTETIDITKTTTVSEFVNSLKEAGLNANFDENNQRIFVNAKDSGKENDFILMGSDSDGDKALKALGLDVALTEKDENGNIVFTEAAANYQEVYDAVYKKALDAGADTDGTVGLSKAELMTYLEELLAEYKEKKTASENAETENESLKTQKTALTTELEVLEDKYAARNACSKLGSELKTLALSIGDANSKAFRQQIFSLAGGGGITDEELRGLSITTTQADGAETTVSLLEEDITKIQEVLNSEDYSGYVTTIGGYLDEYTDDSQTGADIITELFTQDTAEYKEQKNETAIQLETVTNGIKANEGIIKTNKTFFEENAIIGDIISKSENEDANAQSAQEMAGIADLAHRAFEAAEVLASDNSRSGSAIKIAGADAKIKLNGVEYTSSTNSFSVNGLTIEALGVTGDGVDNAMSITTAVDTQGIYDKIKDFLTEYNNVINEMTKLYNADSARDYEPLTDEEKEAMSEEQIEKWENKIKDSLLRRDTTLNGVMSVMINSMAQAFDINGEKLSLSSFGISTLGFLNAPDNENYAYHIDGDEDDENTSSKEDKLMEAIQEDPDKVMEFMKKLTSTLYTAIDNKMKSTDLSSAYKVYNDKEMDKQYKEYSSIISDWEDKVSEREEYYYNKFSQMEVALSKLNSQTSSISGLLGM